MERSHVSSSVSAVNANEKTPLTAHELGREREERPCVESGVGEAGRAGVHDDGAEPRNATSRHAPFTGSG